ncbi:MAG: penicillin-binding protein 2 [Acidobacteria bacterium]|nr:MAG: penicillin-binding protein 2 [Acidobacteriota bacterium]
MIPRERKWRRRRRTLMLATLAASALLAARLVELQVLAHERLAAFARAQASERVLVPGPRGEIVDRDGRILAISVPTRVLVVEPKRIERRALAAIERAARVRPGRLTSRPDDPWELVTRDCDPRCEKEILALVHKHVVPKTAVHLSPGFRRRYPNGPLAASLLGFVTEDGSVAEGLERQYDALLRPTDTQVLQVKDGYRRVWARAGSPIPREPSSLMLTIDARLQEVLENALDEALLRHEARAAEGLILDPRNGEILALAVRPSFDPNRFFEASPERHRNAVVERAHEPGSVMKPFVAAALVESGAAGANDTVFAEHGTWRDGRLTIHDHHPFGRLTLPGVLEVSSNIGIAKFARRLAPDRLYRILSAFGFGRRTGVDLPAESPGTLPPPPRWRGRDRYAICFGYCMTATTLQLAAAFGALANQGRWVTPHVARAWGSPEGSWHRTRAPRERQVLNPATATTIAGWLRRVVEGDHGTGRLAAVPGFTVAGKTGTAEKLVHGHYDRSRNRVVFAGFVPAASPRLVAVVALDEPRREGRTAGRVAAPVFARVAAEALRLLRVEPDAAPPATLLASRTGGRSADRERAGGTR